MYTSTYIDIKTLASEKNWSECWNRKKVWFLSSQKSRLDFYQGNVWDCFFFHTDAALEFPSLFMVILIEPSFLFFSFLFFSFLFFCLWSFARKIREVVVTRSTDCIMTVWVIGKNRKKSIGYVHRSKNDGNNCKCKCDKENICLEEHSKISRTPNSRNYK